MLDIAAARAPFGGFTSERPLQDETRTNAWGEAGRCFALKHRSEMEHARDGNVANCRTR
jgi:hypothetical protein